MDNITLLEESHDEVAVEPATDGHRTDPEIWDITVADDLDPSRGHWWGQLTRAELITLLERGTVEVYDRGTRRALTGAEVRERQR